MINKLKKSLAKLEEQETRLRAFDPGTGPQEQELTRVLDEIDDVRGRLAAYERLARISRGEEV